MQRAWFLTLGQCVISRASASSSVKCFMGLLALSKRDGSAQHRAWLGAGSGKPQQRSVKRGGVGAGRCALPQPSCRLLSQTCCSTSRTAGTWLSTTRAASSRCGSMRAPAYSSLATWRCSSRGSWMTPPHLSLGRRSWQPSLQGEGTRAPRGEELGPACHPEPWSQRHD